MPAPPGASSGIGGYGVEQGDETALAIIREDEELLDGVNQPSEDDFLRAPGGVAFAEILEGDWFLTCNVVLVVRSEEVVDDAKDILRNLLSFCWTSLDYTDKVI